MKSRLLIILIIILASVSVGNAQQTVTENTSSNPVSDETMRQVVRRILAYRFKPVRKKKVIYLAKKGIETSWLPQIQNIEFRLLSEEEIEDRDVEEIYFFTEPQQSNKTYEIGLAYGDPDCGYVGDTWKFRIIATQVRLWKDGGFGGGCGGSDSDFKLPGKLNSYPNELQNFIFFDRGKLKGLKLTISTRADVKTNFGTDCEPLCDYDQNWAVRFTFFNDFSSEVTEGEKRVKIVAKAEYADKLFSITLTPKSKTLFDKVTFPAKFRKSRVYSTAHDGLGGGTNSSYDVYFDRYGLKYNILDKISLTTIKDLKWQKGELASIEYTIPDKLAEEMFTKQE